MPHDGYAGPELRQLHRDPRLWLTAVEAADRGGAPGWFPGAPSVSACPARQSGSARRRTHLRTPGVIGNLPVRPLLAATSRLSSPVPREVGTTGLSANGEFPPRPLLRAELGLSLPQGVWGEGQASGARQGGGPRREPAAGAPPHGSDRLRMIRQRPSAPARQTVR